MLKNRVFEAFGKERNLSKKERNLSRKERNLSREVQDLIFRLKSYGWRTLLFSLQTPFHLAENLGGLTIIINSHDRKDSWFYTFPHNFLKLFKKPSIILFKYPILMSFNM